MGHGRAGVQQGITGAKVSTSRGQEATGVSNVPNIGLRRRTSIAGDLPVMASTATASRTGIPANAVSPTGSMATVPMAIVPKATVLKASAITVTRSSATRAIEAAARSHGPSATIATSLARMSDRRPLASERLCGLVARTRGRNGGDAASAAVAAAAGR